MGNRLYVGNLPFSADEDSVRELFAQDGREVTEVKLITDRDTGRPRGFGFVEMGNSEHAGSRDLRVERPLDGRTRADGQRSEGTDLGRRWRWRWPLLITPRKRPESAPQTGRFFLGTHVVNL